MTKEKNISKITLMDKISGKAVGLVTSEMPKLNKIRKSNSYSNTPSFKVPNKMPFEYINLKGIKIRIAKSILDKNQQTLVLLSPYPQSIMAYAPIWNKLTSKYNVYAYDMPGFGRSGKSVERMNFKSQGEFLKSFIEHFKINDAHLIGPDVGMPTILYYVGTFKTTAKTILIGDGPAIKPSLNGSVIRKMEKSSFWRLIFRIAGAGAIVKAANDIGFLNYVPNKYELSDYKKSYKEKVGDSLLWFKNYATSLSTVDPLFEKIKQPAMIFWGDEDAILYLDNGKNLHERMRNSDLTIFKNCGHFSYLDQHEEFFDMIVTWINKHSQ